MIYLALLVFLYWALKGADLIAGILFGLPRLGKAVLPEDRDLPKVSIIFAARDEETRVREAAASFLAQDYPHFEVIGVDDRSSDRTAALLDSIPDRRLKILTVRELPAGWLGKTHAQHEGYKASTGEWLLFTDGDVLMERGALSAAMQAARENTLAHLTLIPRLVIRSYIEAVFVNYFALAFNARYRPWAAKRRGSLAYAGIGAFNLVSREAYEKIGTHKALALEVADDMILGRMIKRAGFRQMAMYGTDFVRVQWVVGWKGVLNSLQKNGFRGLNYSVMNLLGATAALLTIDVFPLLALVFGRGEVRALGAAAAVMCFFVYLAGQKFNRWSLSSFFLHPLAGIFFVFVLWRSAVSALRDGGVYWRDTFYPLKDLKKGMR